MPSLAGDAIAVIFVTGITLLLNTTGIEIDTRTEANIDRDLKALGFANIVTAALGGIVSCTSISRSVLVRLAGATTRICGLTVAAICAALLLIGPGILGGVPKYVLGGVLFFLGSGLLYQWLIRSSRQLALPEYLSLISITFLIVYWGFIAGVLIALQTHVKIEKGKDGKTAWKVEKRPTSDALLKPLVQKLLGWFSVARK